MAQQKGSPVAQWQALSSLYEQACELDGAARRTWLLALQERDPTLHDGLQRMLAARDQADADGFLDALPPLVSAPSLPAQRDGARIGPYRLVRRLGAGGMAEVWLGERDDGAFRRRVAIKLPYARLAPGTDGNALARRFDRERDILASLRHPNVAALIDAGVSDSGEAWLALEYVEGEPIGRWCDQRRASLRDRLKLFRQVLLAVQHAHANLVIHRDLKPANILVTEAGEVRLLDFGIAKLLEGNAVDETELTRLAGAPLTPRYASPEQLTGAALTTACDVYALGVVLYELLCGLSPYETKVETVSAIERAIVESEPRAPSRRAITEEAAEARSSSVKALRRTLAPELDAVALRCLGKTPAARYSSVDALIAEVDRWLNGEAVLARAPGPWTLALKFAGRNKIGVGFGLAAVLSLAVMAGVAIQLGFEARLESARAGAARDFMLDLFKRADAEKSRGADITARDLLEAGRRDVLTRLAGQPTLQAELLQGIASVQVDMGEHATADSTWAELARLRSELQQPRELAMALTERAFNAVQMNEFARSAPLLVQASELARGFGGDDELQARLALVQGWQALGERSAEKAIERFTTSLGRAEAQFGPSDERVLQALNGMANAERRLGHYDRAVALHERRLAAAALNPQLTLRDWAWLDSDGIDLLYWAGHFARVVRESSEAVARCDRGLGPETEACRRMLLKTVQAQLRIGAVDAAAQQLPRVETIAADLASPYASHEAAMVRFRIDSLSGRRDGPSFDRVRAIAESAGDTKTAASFRPLALGLIAESRLRRGETAAALEWLDRARSPGEGAAAPTPQRAYLKSLRGLAYLQGNDPAAAVRLLREAQGDFAALLGAEHPFSQQVALNLALALNASGRSDEARRIWGEAEPILQRALGPESPAYARIRVLRGRLDSAPSATAAAEFFL